MRKWLLLAAGLCYYGITMAQIVNIETKRQGFDTLGWFGQWDIGTALVKNNAAVFTVNTALRADLVQSKTRWLLLGDYQVVRAADENFINAGFFHLRYARYLSQHTRWEAFSQVQYNEQLQLRVRALLGTGPRFLLLRKEKSRVYLGTLLMLEYNEIGTDNLVFRDQRLSTYLSFSVRPSPTFQLNGTTYYQPLLSDFAEARLSTANSAVFKITQVLSFQTTFTLSYDSRLHAISPTVPLTTYSWTNGLRVSF